MKKFLSLVLALVMTMSLVTISAGAADFTDADVINYDEAVGVISGLDIVGGYADESFKPGNTLTRGAAAKIICNMILGPTTAADLPTTIAPYPDVPAGSTYAGYIAFLKSEGIIGGYSDGSFRPGNPLTGYAFMKMLLGVLGYDAEAEIYFGENSDVNVAKRALFLGLDDGLKGAFDGSKPATREEACLYAFNAMFCDMVEYKSSSSVQIGDVVIKNNSEATSTTKTYQETYFKNLKSVPADDVYGRPATKWTNGKTTIGTYVEDADLTYTKEVNSKTIYADLGLTEDTAITEYALNGDASVAIPFAKIEKNNTSDKLGGNGVQIEVFYTESYWDEENDTTVPAVLEIVRVDTYVGEVTKVAKKTSTTERKITISGAPAAFETEEYALEDIVLWTKGKDADGNVVVATVAPATKVEAVEITRVTGSSKVRVNDATEYSYSANKTGTFGSADLEKVYDLYLDAYGYLITSEIVQDVYSEGLVLDTGKDTGRYSVDSYWAKVLTPTAEVVEIETDKLYDGTDGANLEGTIVKYKEVDGEYVLTDIADDADTAIDYKGGETSIAINGSTYYVNAKTIFVVTTGTATKPVYTAYVGYKAAPEVYAASGALVDVYCKTGSVATLIYIDDATVKGVAATDKVFVLGDNTTTSYTDKTMGTYYAEKALVNGTVKTIYADAPISGNVLFESVTYNKYGHLDVSECVVYADKATDPDDYVVNTWITAKYEDEVIGLDGEFYAVADGAEVWEIQLKANSSAPNTVVASSLAAVEVDYTNANMAVIKNGEVAALYYVVDSNGETITEGPTVFPTVNAGDEPLWKYVTGCEITDTGSVKVWFNTPFAIDASVGYDCKIEAANGHYMQQVRTNNGKIWPANTNNQIGEAKNKTDADATDGVVDFNNFVLADNGCEVTLTLSFTDGTTTYSVVGTYTLK